MDRKFGKSAYDEKSFLQKRQEEMKQFIYEVVYQLLKDDEG